MTKDKGQRTKDKGRKGVTLAEVLIAILMLGIGLLSLLALFPYGAMHMARSIRDQRAAESAAKAEAVARIWNVRNDPTVYPFYTNPGTGLPALPNGTNGPSYPVFVDPLGASLGSSRIGAVTGISPGFARSSHSIINTSQQITQWLTLTDDLAFNENGLPKNGLVMREGRYSWAYLCRQTRAYGGSPPSPNGVDLTIVVFEQRSRMLEPSGFPDGESAYQATFTAGSNMATLTWPVGVAPPPIRQGRWILDATVSPAINGYFYRVEKYTQLGPNTMEVELHRNARASSGPNGVAVVFQNVVEVFEKGP